MPNQSERKELVEKCEQLLEQYIPGQSVATKNNLHFNAGSAFNDKVIAHGDNEVPPEVRPKHYVSGGMEAWDVIEAFDLNFNAGNAFKYIARYSTKSGIAEMIKDLSKAVTYLNREIVILHLKHPESASGSTPH